MSVYADLPAVMVFGTEPFKILRSHPEHEIICKYRIIILKNRSNFTLIFTFQIQMHRSMFLLIVFRIKIIQRLYPEMSGHSLDSRCRTIELSLQMPYH